MAGLPSGTVSLLFSDIEGSTALVHRLGPEWAGVLQQQRDLCRAAWAEHGGHELGTEGDSFFVAFATAHEAVAAAVAAQRAISSASWPDAVALRVRIGVHTGSPQRHDDGYVGMDVHRAARVAAAAHGGQILVSEATGGLARPHLPPGVALRDRGEHLLKDIPERLRLFQVEAASLDADFPPPRSLGSAGSLPPPLTPTVGRDGELAELAALLASGARLVTLTGPGGTGKTRLATTLAAQVSGEYPDGVHFVPLATIGSAREMWPAIAQALDVPAAGQVPPGFFDHVAGRRVLLVLDNLEQIPDADDVVRQLLAAAPHLTLLATSRRPLHVAGEYDHAVPVLEPDGALQLFADRAARARRGFAVTDANRADITALCAQLDGLPLAVELVAARVKLLSPAAILGRIDSVLDLAAGDRAADSRQRTLRGAIDWSYRLLDADQQLVLDHLGVFEGGATLDAVAAVVPDHDLGRPLDDLLLDLVEASLVRTTESVDGEPRFHLLVTVKRFAGERLSASSRRAAAEAAHAQYYYDWAASWHDRVRRGDGGLGDALQPETANLRAVIDTAAHLVTDPGRYADETVPPRHVVTLFCLLARTTDRIGTVEDWVRLGLELPDAEADPLGVAGLLCQQAFAHSRLARHDSALEVTTLARTTLARTARGADDGPVPRWVDAELLLAEVVYAQCWSLAITGRLEEAAAAASGVRLTDDARMDARIRLSACRFVVAYFAEDYAAARVHARAVLELRRERGYGPRSEVADAFNNLYCIDVADGDMAAAQRGFTLAVAELRDDDDPADWVTLAENFAQAIGAAHPLLCARVYGMAATHRVVEGIPLDPVNAANDEAVLAPIRARVTAEAWAEAFDRGRTQDMFALLREMAALPAPTG